MAGNTLRSHTTSDLSSTLDVAPANFRPISNLNNISKIIERLFLSRIQPHVCTSGNFSPTQSAYRRYHSTEIALLHTLDYVYHSSDNRQPTIVVSLDFSSAFDTIDHSILLSRLNDCFGLSGNALAGLNHISRTDISVYN